MGFGMRGELWTPQITGLSSEHRIAWYDHRGVGESSAGPKPIWRMADMARDCLSVIDALTWERVHLVGVSMGGMIAQEVATRAPHRLTSLTLIATHSGGPLQFKIPPMKGLRAFLKVNLTRGRRRADALRTLLYPDHFVAGSDLQALNARLSARLARPVPTRTVLAHLNAVIRHDVRNRLDKISVPTLIVRPGQDILVKPDSAERLKAQIPGARVLSLPDAGHGLIWQKADTLNDALLKHFADADSKAKHR